MNQEQGNVSKHVDGNTSDSSGKLNLVLNQSEYHPITEMHGNLQTLAQEEFLDPSNNDSLEESFNSWKRGKLLGEGRFGKVYSGLLSNGTSIAVKIVHLSRETKFDALPLNELTIMRGLSHPNIVSFLGSVIDDSNLTLFMEFVTGDTLDKLLDIYGSLEEETIRVYTIQICKALVYCHSRGVVHRDIKSRNILVEPSGRVKLIDFGSAKQLKCIDERDTLNSAFNYTPLWTAPEVMIAETYDRKIDIWSLGCVLIEMVTAMQPWSEIDFPSSFSALFHIAKHDSRPRIPEHLSPELNEFIRLCLTRNPVERPDARELLSTVFLSK